jgi:hypothetical protein
MRHACLIALLALIGLGLPAPPAVAQPAMAGDSLACVAASAAVQRAQQLPPRLLDAIGLVETGRVDPLRHVAAPWPWSVNAQGEGRFYASKQAAMAAVAQLLADGINSIDVGCMQINLRDHPDAFASLDEAFDPGRNTAYAARFLAQLFARTGSWPKAAAAYHSQTPAIAEPYAARVMAVWPEAGRYGGGAAASRIDPDDALTPSFRARLLADEAARTALVAAMRGPRYPRMAITPSSAPSTKAASWKLAQRTAMAHPAGGRDPAP